MDRALDTTAEAELVQVEAYRRMGGPGRAAVVFRLNDLAREAAMAGIRAVIPTMTTSASDWPMRGSSSATSDAEGLASARTRRALTVEQEILARVTRLLVDLGIPYMITGSLASSFHGRPRTTHDADIVIDPGPEALDRLVAELSAAHLYVDLTVARDALRHRRQFNVIDAASAFKLDLIVRKDRAFSREEFGRRLAADLAGTPVALATAEDTVLSKLEWAKKGGGSDRQLADVAGIIAVKGAELDQEYIAAMGDGTRSPGPVAPRFLKALALRPHHPGSGRSRAGTRGARTAAP